MQSSRGLTIRSLVGDIRLEYRDTVSPSSQQVLELR